MKIFNGQEAFAELSAGRIIEARHKDALEFDLLDNFPATIMVNPEYEFRIALTFITIGEMQVPEPVKKAPAKGTQCFAPSLLTEELSKSFKWKNSDLDLALLQRGQVHFEQEHAVIHAQALIAVSGGSIDMATTQEVVEETSKSDQSDESFDETDPVIQKFIDAIGKCNSEYELQGVELNLKGNQHKLHHSEFDELTKRITEKRESINEVKKAVTSETLKGFADQNAQCTDYVQKINACASQDELYQLNQAVIADDTLNIDQQEQLVELTHQKAEAIAPDAKTEVEQPSLIDEIDQQANKVVQDKIYKDAMSGNGQASYPVDMLYTKKKQMLISRIQEMDSIEALERLAPAIPAAKLNPEDHQELLRIYAERKTAMQHADA